MSVNIAQQDLYFEEELGRNPFYLKIWWNYLQYKLEAKPVERFVIYERALRCLPRSFKLWKFYLSERSNHLASKSVTDRKYDMLIETYERAIVHMHKMPQIWLNYCKLMVKLGRGSQCRDAFDRALQALPITQHEDIWVEYISWVQQFGVVETAVRIYRRYLMFDSTARESFVNYLESTERYDEAARQLVACLNDEHFYSPTGKSEHQLWMHLCDLCASHADAISSVVNVESIIRGGISRFSDEVGRLWNSLADYYIRLGYFEKARDVFEEGMNSVTTVRDFTIVFDAYVKVEESILSTKMAIADDGNEDLLEDINLRLARLEYLMEKRPLLLNSVVLRQNPHNVHEWQKRSRLLKNNKNALIATYGEAVKTINPSLAIGKLSGIWFSLSRFYEKENDLENARTVFEQATKVNYKTVDELASVWCAWAEMELRHELFDQALQVMQQAVSEPYQAIKSRRLYDPENNESYSADKLYKSIKIWSFYLDLEESLGSTESCKAAYDRAFDLKVVTPQMALNYASYLEDRNFFEESFKVYERSVGIFTYPQLKPIWLLYLNKFIERYHGSKLERIRDLFEQAVKDVPPEDAAEFYIAYAKYEEQYGSARHAMAVYDRATQAVTPSKRLNMYRLYLKKVEHYFGIIKTRPIYERALQELDDELAKTLCGDFAGMERALGEIDRARAVYQYGSQFADPRRDPNYWRIWREFEEAHGSEDTFRDMLRVQRSVESAFAQVNYLAVDAFIPQSIEHPPADLVTMERIADETAKLKAKELLSSSGVKRKFDESDIASDSLIAARDDDEIDI